MVGYQAGAGKQTLPVGAILGVLVCCFGAVIATACTHAAAGPPAVVAVRQTAAAVPASQPGAKGYDPAGPGCGALAFAGAQLYAGGYQVGACDLPGSYNVPQFDRIRAHFAADASPSEGLELAVFDVAADGAMEPLPMEPVFAAGYVDFNLGAATRPGGTYQCVAGRRRDAGFEAVDWMWRLEVQGWPWNQVWSLDVGTGRVRPVGQTDLGYEVESLVGGAGNVYAVGVPGGEIWRGLQVVQQLDGSLAPAGPAVAVVHEANQLSRQYQATLGLLPVVAATAVPPLVGAAAWDGYLPPAAADPAGGSAATAAYALVAMSEGGPRELLAETVPAGSFVSGPALSDDGGRLYYVTQQYGAGLTISLWRRDLPPEFAGGMAGTPPPGQQLRRLTLAAEYVGEYVYGGGVAVAGESLWWDVYSPDGGAEVWLLGGAAGLEEPPGPDDDLVIPAAGLPLPSPDGRHVLCRTAHGGIVLTSRGEPVQTVDGAFTGASWLPGGGGLLLCGVDGITLAPLGGAPRRLSAFGARQGTFVSDTEYWFVSNRRPER